MKNALLALLVAAAAVLVWVALRGDEAEPAVVPTVTEAAGTETPAQPATAAEGADVEAPATAGRREVAPAALAEPPAARAATVTLKGRCVDAASGGPLAGCEVEVHGWRANSARMYEYLKDHDEVVWEDPPEQTTGRDGLFAFTFVPPPPYQFTLDIRAPELVRVSGRWSTLEPGTEKDFGDVPLVRGSRVSGVVADSDGVPQDGVEVYIDQDGPWPRRDGVGPRRGYRTRSKGDGTFAFGEPVKAGTWDVKLHGRQKVAPASLTIPEGEVFTTLAIETVPVGDVETVEGVVVDEAGAPVPGVMVSFQPERGGFAGWVVSTGEDGSFAVERRQGDPDEPIQLLFLREGYERLTTEQRYAWGSEGLRFVLKRGLSVDVTVVDGETGEPIEEYAVRCFSGPQSGAGWMSTDFEIRNRGHHPGGKTTVEGIRRGPRFLLVEPTGDTWQTSAFVRFEVTDAGAPPQRVELYRGVSQTLRVLRASGEPVAGTAVELLRPLGEVPVTLETRALELPKLMHHSAVDKASVVMAGVTDARGELVLRGPPHEVLALRVLGPGHQPWCDPEVTLAPGEPRVVTVLTGATVAGVIGPADFLEQVRGSEARSGPAVVFWRNEQGEREAFPGSGPFDGIRLGEGGAFRATGVPPGTWNAYLKYWISHGEGGGSSLRSVFLQSVPGLADGEERELNADVGHLVPGTLAGTVLLDGQPLAQAYLQLRGRRPDGRGGEQEISGAAVQTAADGTFSVQAEPATYHLWVQVPRPGDGIAWLPATEVVTVAPRDDLVRVFHVPRGVLRLRVLRSNGEPVAGIEPSAATPDGTWSGSAEATDADGRTTLLGPPGTVVLTAVPKRLTDSEAARKFWRENAGVRGAWDNAKLQLGRAEIPAGEAANEVEVRLPASSEY